MAETILGHYPEYLDEAKRRKANCFNLSEEVWNKLSKTERWEANKRFLDEAMARGDEIILPRRSID